MSRMRVLGAVVLVVAVAIGATGCSKDEKKQSSSDRGAITFADPPKGSEDLGLCYAYKLGQIKELIGGGNMFKRLAPEAIGKETDPVHGEACSWARSEPNGDALMLRIEVRNFGTDTATLDKQFTALRSGTIGAETVPNLGDGAFSSTSKETSLLQIRSAGYLLTLSSRAAGSLKPVPVDTLQLLGAAGLEQLP